MRENTESRSGGFPDPPIPTRDEEGVMVPPWVKFPNLPRQSMGWRMGMGEAYLEDSEASFFGQARASRVAAQTKHPEPDEWKGFYERLGRT